MLLPYLFILLLFSSASCSREKGYAKSYFREFAVTRKDNHKGQVDKYLAIGVDFGQNYMWVMPAQCLTYEADREF